MEGLMRAREKSKAIVNKFFNNLEAGVLEEDAREELGKMIHAAGAEKLWHPSKVRFGRNTLKSFRDLSEPHTRLKESDICFVDIGPVFNGYEGDYGATFVLGENQEQMNIRDAAEKVFMEVQDHWRMNNISGHELYEFAQERAQTHGAVLNLSMDAHLLAEFPHALTYKGSLRDKKTCIETKTWVLEILLRHPNLPFGAFYEDLLIHRG